MWKGRFAQQTADLLQRYGESISYDWRLYPHDIAGSIAHARAQMNAGLLSEDEFAQIETGLREIEKEIESGEFEFSIELEDIHMNIEAALTRKIGAAAVTTRLSPIPASTAAAPSITFSCWAPACNAPCSPRQRITLL